MRRGAVTPVTLGGQHPDGRQNGPIVTLAVPQRRQKELLRHAVICRSLTGDGKQ